MNLQKYFSWLNRHQSIILLAVIIITVLLRIPLIGGSFWLDEAAQALESTRPFSQQFDIAQDFQPPLLHLIVHVAAQISHSEWWLRLWGALIPGVLTVWGVWKIAREHHKHTSIALIAAVLLATSSLHIFFSQELRPYALPAAIAIWSWWLLLRKDTSSAKKSWLFGILTTAGLYSSYLFPFVIIGQAGFALKKNLLTFKELVLAGAIAAGLFAPWIPKFLEQLAVGGALRETLPGWESVVSTPQMKALPLVAAKFLYGVLEVEPLGWHGLGAILVACAILYLWWKLSTNAIVKDSSTLFFWWVIVPLLIAWLASFAIPVIQPKRVLFAMPGLYLWLSVLITTAIQAKATLVRQAGLTLLTVLLAINIYSLFQYYTNPQLQRENWRGLHQYITTNYSTNSVVVMAFSAPFAPWEWYNQGDFPTLAANHIYLTETDQIEPLIQSIYDQFDHVLVFDYLRDLTDPERLVDQLLLEYGYQESGIYDAGSIGFIRIYSQPKAVLSYTQVSLQACSEGRHE